MRCAICSTELGHPDAYCPTCWTDGSSFSRVDFWGRTPEETAAVEAEYNRAMEEWYQEEMREAGATMGGA